MKNSRIIILSKKSIDFSVPIAFLYHNIIRLLVSSAISSYEYVT